MKAAVYSLDGKKVKETELPELFKTAIREELVARTFEAQKVFQPYSHLPEAGKKHSAAGTISHRRHEWKGQYGKGISRVPRKKIWRRGTQFMWIGAEVSGTRGGRRSHGPKGFRAEKKVNKKEQKLALNSALAATVNGEYLKRRYSTIEKIPFSLPIVIESKLENSKSKQIISFLKEVFGDFFTLTLKRKQVRAGKGKLRGRKYKSNAGILLITGKDEKVKFKGVDIRTVNQISVSDLYPLGRLTMYTEKALEELK